MTGLSRRLAKLVIRAGSVPWLKIGLALAIGTVGGAIFVHLHIPLAWMIGAMVATTIAALAGLPVRGPGRMRDAMIVVLGVMVGSAFTPDALAGTVLWLPSIATLLVFTVVTTAVLGMVLRRLLKWDAASAYCSAAPGGFMEMVLLSSSMGGDMRTVSLMHTIRIMTTVLVIPIFFRIAHGYVPEGTAFLGRIVEITWSDGLLLLASGIAGYYVARWLKMPLPVLTGPMIFSAAIHATGWTAAHPPAELVAIAQIVFGASIGCRFAGVTLDQIVRVMLTSVAMTLVMLAFAVLCALGLQAATGLSFSALLLAFSPGGVAEMNLITVALQIDPAFVATHHIIRIGFLIIVGPVLMKFLVGRSSSQRSPSEARQQGE